MRGLFLLSGLLTVAAVSGCGTEPAEAIGTWVATTFRVTPAGQAEIDLLQIGATLSITIDADNNTTGTRDIPAVGGEPPFNASMAGTAQVTASTVRFNQAADTFVRDLTFTRGQLELTVVNRLDK